MLPLAVALLGLLGCSVAPVMAPDQQSQAWRQHRQAVSALQVWTLTARVSISNEHQAWNGVLEWRQEPGQYRMQFNAPFGQGAFQLQGNPRGALLRFADGQEFLANSAEEIIHSQLGWRLPVNALRYWVAGVPLPGSEPALALDGAGHLASLEQERWRIQYPDYVQVGDVALPRRVILQGEEFTVRLVIDHWDTAPHG